MRGVSSFCLGLLAVTAFGPAVQATPVYPKGALELEQQLLPRQTAEAKAWIKKEAEQEATGRFISEEMSRNAARKFGASGSDVSLYAFLILMETARQADANVYTLVTGVQAASASRADARQRELTSSGIASAQQAQLSGGLQSAQQNQPNAFVPLASTDGSNPIRDARDASSAIPPPGMTLQDAMDRESKVEDLLAAAMKRVSPPG
jgi:hypothetical protein